MTITVDDLKFLASQRMNDDPDGGGLPTGTAVQDGVENNVFPDIGTLDRAQGRLQLRKIYAACLSLSQDTYIGAHVIIDDDPNDPNIDGLMFRFGNLTTERSDVTQTTIVSGADYYEGVSNGFVGYPLYANDSDHTSTDVGSTAWKIVYSNNTTPPFKVGDYVFTNIDLDPQPVLTAGSGGSDQIGNPILRITVARGHPTTGANTVSNQGNGGAPTNPNDANLYGVASVTQAAAAGATKIKLNKYGIHLQPMALDTGRALIFRPNDFVVISETSSTTGNVSTGTTNTGFTNLARVRIIGSDGTVIGRYDVGATQPSGTGASVNFAAGTINVTSTSGWAQPVTIEARIEDMRISRGINPSTKEMLLNAALSHSFSTAAKVSSILVYGDLQGKVHQGFSQTAFTGAWSDDVIGSSPLADYNDVLVPVQINNRGSITERWMCLFTNSTTFNVVGEQVGVVSLGNLITQDCAPINPATLAPYFTIKKEGWGNGWAGGNLYRFNTDGANFPIWVGRNVNPSDPVPGQDSISIQLRGDIDA